MTINKVIQAINNSHLKPEAKEDAIAIVREESKYIESKLRDRMYKPPEIDWMAEVTREIMSLIRPTLIEYQTTSQDFINTDRSIYAALIGPIPEKSKLH